MSELKECPCCGPGTTVTTVPITWADTGRVQCHKCLLMAASVGAWNTRSESPLIEELQALAAGFEKDSTDSPDEYATSAYSNCATQLRAIIERNKAIS